MKVGLTGGIGSGKSTVARMLVELGAWLVDTDAIARALTGPEGAAMAALVDAFGSGIKDSQGGLDRAALRQKAFSQESVRQRLEAVLHPMIGAASLAQADQAAPGQAIVFDVPLLTETRWWRARVDRVLVVDCLPSTQIERVVRRSGWAEAEVQRVVGLQATRVARCAIGDAVIFNESLVLPALRREIEALWVEWTAAA
jgi:dephospho-CoA kinase